VIPLRPDASPDQIVAQNVDASVTRADTGSDASPVDGEINDSTPDAPTDVDTLDIGLDVTAGDDGADTASDVSSADGGTDAATDVSSAATDVVSDGVQCTFTDDFNSTVMPSFWSIDTIGAPTFSPVRTGTVLEISPTGVPGAPMMTPTYSGYVSGATYDLSNGYAALEVPVISSGANAQVRFELTDGTRSVGFGISGGSGGICTWNEAGSRCGAYDPAAQRWLRIRPAAPGMWAFDGSSDGVSWGPIGNQVTSLDFTRVRIHVTTGYDTTSPTPAGPTDIDNFSAQYLCP
jgi:hypothetical protein